MKKEGILSVIFALLLALSIGSYVFLKSNSSAVSPGDDSYTIHQTEAPAEKQQSEIILLDVALIKKAYEVAKRVMHVAR